MSTQEATLYITRLVFMQHSDICTHKHFYDRNYVTSPARVAKLPEYTKTNNAANVSEAFMSKKEGIQDESEP